MKNRFEKHHNGRRYWAHRIFLRSGKIKYKFYSDHWWPFFHGHFVQDTNDPDEAYAAFVDWLPFDLKETEK